MLIFFLMKTYVKVIIKAKMEFHVVRYCFLNNALSLNGSYDCT